MDRVYAWHEPYLYPAFFIGDHYNDDKNDQGINRCDPRANELCLQKH